MAKILNSIIVIIYFLSFNGSINQSCVKKTDPVKPVVEVVIPPLVEPTPIDTVVPVVVFSETPEAIINDTPIKEDPYILYRNNIQNIYLSQIGIREKTGRNDGKEVEMYLKSAGLGKGNPWCASFIYWTFKQNGTELNVPSGAKGWVPSYFPSKKTIYVRGKYSKMDPKYGDLIGIWFENKGRLAHIGFYDHEDDTYFYTVEGNTNEAGSREGDGVYNKRRIKRQVHSISNWID